jgi:hypothetical protein
MVENYRHAIDAHSAETFAYIPGEDLRVLGNNPICFGHFSVKDPICRDCSFRIKCKGSRRNNVTELSPISGMRECNVILS